MKVMGIDFTSRPTRRKPITCMHCILEGHVLRANYLEEWPDFTPFEEALKKPGPWIAGIDFPFGQSRTFVENIGWPGDWTGYVKHAGSLGRTGFHPVHSTPTAPAAHSVTKNIGAPPTSQPRQLALRSSMASRSG